MHDSKKYNYFFSYSRDIYDEIASLLIKNIEEYSLRLWVDCIFRRIPVQHFR